MSTITEETPLGVFDLDAHQERAALAATALALPVRAEEDA